MVGPVQISSLDPAHAAFAGEVGPSHPAPPSDISHAPHLSARAHIPLIEVSSVPAAARVTPGPLHHVSMRIAREVPQEHELAPIMPPIQLRYVCNSVVANPAPPIIPPHMSVSKHHPHHICLPVIVRRPSIRMACCPSHPSHRGSVGCHSKAAISSLSCDVVAIREVVLISWASCVPSIVTTEVVEPNIPGISIEPGTKPASIPGIANAKPIVVCQLHLRVVAPHILICRDNKMSSIPCHAAIAPSCGFCQT